MTVRAEQDEARLSIGEVARRSGMEASTIRYYERVGLLTPPERRGGQRRYEPSIVTALTAIGVAKAAGFSLSEIEHLFNGFDRDVSPSERWAHVAGNKLRELDVLVKRIEAMRSLLRRGLECGCLRLEDCELVMDGATLSGGAAAP
jgi:MerR family transcriptional regulator, redox-sensitive transcriptional activator SoxR